MTDYYVLHSGGLDSTTALTLATQAADRRNVYSVAVNYGQRHIKELEAARTTAARLNATRIPLDLTGYGASVKSALTDHTIDVPDGEYEPDGMAKTVVPGRNAVLLAAAAGLAASTSGEHPAVVVTGVHAGDHHVYPDCRPEFIQAQAHALNLATGAQVQAPFVNMSKGEIVKTGHRINAPLAETWSCYNGRDLHCGTCGTCQERKAAFHYAQVTDPTTYEQ